MTSTALKAALVALGIMAFAGAAAAGDVTGNNRQWTPWHDATLCKLQLNRVYQPNKGQPIHAVIGNVSNVRLQYRVSVTVLVGNRAYPSGEIVVDNANAREQSDRPSSMPFPGSIEGNVVKLVVTSCGVRS